MFLGAMIMGPLGGWVMKKFDAIWDGKVRPGFEMLIDNFSAGIVGLLLAMLRLLRHRADRVGRSATAPARSSTSWSPTTCCR